LYIVVHVMYQDGVNKMGYLEDHRALFTKMMDMMEQQLGPNCEIVLHDLSLPYEHTIIDIRNGHVTGRSVGDGGSNLGLEVLVGTVKNGDRYNYITYLKSSRVLRSSSMYIRDENDALVACFCINNDITEEIKFEDYLKRRNHFSLSDHPAEQETEEFFPDNVQDLLGHLISESQKVIDIPVERMEKDDKINFLRHLDRKGAFLISKSSEAVCEYLGISKFSLYKYLEIIRGNGNKQPVGKVSNKKTGGDSASPR
jgi:predicted transcriptional regulator YheO